MTTQPTQTEGKATDLELEAPVCYFNQEAFPLGAYVQSGAEVLQCTEHGVWVRKGEKRPA